MGKLDNNGLWESSRMILPEHRARLIESNREYYNAPQDRPELDEDAMAPINELFTLSINFGEPISVRMYSPNGPVTVTGTVEKMDSLNRRVRISGDWYMLADVIGVVDT